MSLLAIEAFVLMALGVMCIAVRIFARVKLVGFRKLQADDYLMVVAGIVYAVAAGFVYLTAVVWKGLETNGMTDEQRRTLDPNSQEYHDRSEAAKAHVAGWESYVFVLWTIKASWFVFYQRLVGVLMSPRQVYFGAALLASTYIGLVLTLLFSCHPMRKYWQINPDPGPECAPTTSRINIITGLVLNALTDIYLMAIPIPMVVHTSFSWVKKIGLVLLFSGGVFVTIAGVTRGVLMIQNPDRAAILSGPWALRELFVAIITSNLPMLVPLVRRWAGPAGEVFRGCPPGTDDINRAVTNSQPVSTGAERKRSSSLERARTGRAAPPVDIVLDVSDIDPYDERIEVARGYSQGHADRRMEEGRIESVGGCFSGGETIQPLRRSADGH